MQKTKQSFEECHDSIDKALEMRRSKWKLNSIPWFSFDDVKQIIKLHIFKKWSMWDQSLPLGPWLNRVIIYQLSNIYRNNYSTYSKPCFSCEFNYSLNGDPEGGRAECGLTKSGTQCSECPLYAKWEKTRKRAYDINIPVSIENHNQEDRIDASFMVDYNKAENKLHSLMKKNLSDKLYFVYKLMFIDCLPDDEIAKILRFKTTEKNRTAGYKQIKNIKNLLLKKAKVILVEEDVFLDV